MVAVAGRDLTVTSPDKVFFAERGETKLDLVRYYLAVAEPLMRTMGGRPMLMQRFPHGAAGSSFFQKRVPDDGARLAADDDRQYAERDDVRALVARRHRARDLGREPRCLGFHVWPFVDDDPEHADELRIDLDPQPGVDFDDVRGRGASYAACSTSSGSPATPRRPETVACTSMSGWSLAGTPTRCVPRRSPSPASSNAAAPS